MILESIICILISIFAGLLTNTLFNINSIVKNNWSEFQCTTIGSMLYPFFGPKDLSLADNEAQCNANKFNSMFNANIQGTNNNISFLTKQTEQMNNTINNMREKMSSMERNAFKDLNAIWQRIWGLYYKVIQIFIILYKTIEKIINLFLQIMGVGMAAFYSFGSLYNGIVRKLMNSIFFCFHPNTPIKLKYGYKKIKDIRLGDELSNQNKVISVYKFLSKNSRLYNYNGIIVSGYHQVRENNQWIYIKDSKYSQIYKDNCNLIYCLNTQKHNIITKGNIKFKDFEGNYNINLNKKYYQHILNYLNQEEKEEITLKHYQPAGLDKDTLIQSFNGELIPISKLKLGQNLGNQNKVIGIMKSYCDDLYCYKNNIISGSTIIYENKWKLVCNSKHSKKLNKKSIIYHIQTSNCSFETENYKCKSIIPINNINLLEKLETIMN